MHELSIAMSILDFAEEEAGRRGDIQAIHVKVGQLSGVVKEALVSAYDLAREGTPFEACRLIVEETPIVIHCRSCDADRAVASAQELCCSSCGAPAFDVVQGRELQVVGLELES